MTISQTTRCIDQQTLNWSKSKPTAYGSEPFKCGTRRIISRYKSRYIDGRKGRRTADIRALNVSLKTKHDTINLIIVAYLTASDKAGTVEIQSRWEGASREGRTKEPLRSWIGWKLQASFGWPPTVAGVCADIKTCPMKDRARGYENGSFFGRWQISGEGRAGQSHQRDAREKQLAHGFPPLERSLRSVIAIYLNISICYALLARQK